MNKTIEYFSSIILYRIEEPDGTFYCEKKTEIDMVLQAYKYTCILFSFSFMNTAAAADCV